MKNVTEADKYATNPHMPQVLLLLASVGVSNVGWALSPGTDFFAQPEQEGSLRTQLEKLRVGHIPGLAHGHCDGQRDWPFYTLSQSMARHSVGFG